MTSPTGPTALREALGRLDRFTFPDQEDIDIIRDALPAPDPAPVGAEARASLLAAAREGVRRMEPPHQVGLGDPPESFYNGFLEAQRIAWSLLDSLSDEQETGR